MEGEDAQMRITQRSDGYSIDPQAVRPGSSDALFARTIDATQRPPLVKAQEAVTAAVPRIIDSVSPPLLGGTLGIAVLGVMLASHRVRFRLVPVLTSAVLLLPVSNYHAAQTPVQAQTVEAIVEEQPRTFERFDWRFRSHAEVEPVQLPEEFTENPDSDEVEEYPTPSREFLVPPEITEGVLPLVEMVVPEEWTDEEQLRVLRRRAERLMEEIRKLRLEQELEERRRSLSHALSQ
jgi:hypothetical protein